MSVRKAVDEAVAEGDKDHQIAILQQALVHAKRQLIKAQARDAAIVEAVHQGALEAQLIVGRANPVKAPARDRRMRPCGTSGTGRARRSLPRTTLR